MIVNDALRSILVQCATENSRIMYNLRHGNIEWQEAYDKLIILLNALGEATEIHGDSVYMDSIKNIVWGSIERNKYMKNGYERTPTTT